MLNGSLDRWVNKTVKRVPGGIFNLIITFKTNTYFQQWIKDYQQQLVPAHLSGLMRVGYWDNKVTHNIVMTLIDSLRSSRSQNTCPSIHLSPVRNNVLRPKIIL